MSEKDINEISDLENKLNEKLTREKEEIGNIEKFETEKKEIFRKFFSSIKFVLFFASLLYIWLKWPDIYRSFEPNRPLRMGEYTDNKEEDMCIAMLWKAAEMGNKDSLRCPKTSSQYVYSENGLCCPNPQVHGLKSLCLKNKMVYAR